MGLIEDIMQIAKRYSEAKEHILTEEATKTSLIIPFIQALGYDTWNPLEVIPEYNCELPGTKKGDKVDFMIKKNNEAIILIECKHHSATLDISQESQLMRYFHSISSSKIAILTNGVQYRFYTDLDDKNKMDSRPFFLFEITAMNDVILKEVQRYAKSTFNIDKILPAAEELKYTGAIKKFLLECLNDPHNQFVDVLARQAYDGKLTEKRFEKFKEIVKKAFNQFVSDRVSDRLSSALKEEKASAESMSDTTQNASEAGEENAENKGTKIVTTQEEKDAYNIIKAILAKCVDVRRIAMRDMASYCGILLDNNNRRPICRLYFNNPKNMSIGIFDRNKNESKHVLEDLDGLFAHSDELTKNIAEMGASSADSTRQTPE